jgi:hypothetical protein
VPPPGVPQSHRLEPAAAAVTSTVPALPVSEGIDKRTPGGRRPADELPPTAALRPKRDGTSATEKRIGLG